MPLSIISELEPERLAQQLELAAEGKLPSTQNTVQDTVQNTMQNSAQTVERALDDMMAREALLDK